MKDLLENCKEMSLYDIDVYFEKKYHDTDAHKRSRYLNQFFNGAQNKGSYGIWLEWLLTGRRGNNDANSDLYVNDSVHNFDIKTYTVNNKGIGTSENKTPLTSVSYEKIEETPFASSAVLQKTKKSIRFGLTKGRTPEEKKFIKIIMVDLSPYLPQIEREYEEVRSLISEGNAHLMTSRARVDEGYILTTRTAGTKTYRKYKTKKGIEYVAKPYAFVIVPAVIERIKTDIILA
jgi:hypothetical protein